MTGLAVAAETAAARGERTASTGIDTWAVDYGLVNSEGELVALERIRATVRARGGVLPDRPAAVVRCIHIVGGGSQNRLLCQLTADATGKTVVAGPVEATALGNILIQARAAGVVSGTLAELRRFRSAR